MAAVRKVAIALEGAEQLERKLRLLEPKLFKKVIRNASKKAMQPMVVAAKTKAPIETGLLKKSIGMKQKQYTRARVVATIVGPRKGFKKLVKVLDQFGNLKEQYRDPVNYAHLVEFGTAAHALGSGSDSRKQVASGAQHPGSDAKPFLRPAFDENEHKALAIYRAELSKGVIAEATQKI